MKTSNCPIITNHQAMKRSISTSFVCARYLFVFSSVVRVVRSVVRAHVSGLFKMYFNVFRTLRVACHQINTIISNQSETTTERLYAGSLTLRSCYVCTRASVCRSHQIFNDCNLMRCDVQLAIRQIHRRNTVETNIQFAKTKLEIDFKIAFTQLNCSAVYSSVFLDFHLLGHNSIQCVLRFLFNRSDVCHLTLKPNFELLVTSACFRALANSFRLFRKLSSMFWPSSFRGRKYAVIKDQNKHSID